MSEQIYPVYVLHRVAAEIFERCRKTAPREMLGRLIGYRSCWQGQDYTAVVDWVSGSLDNGATHARFTENGIRECELFLDERYGQIATRPVEVGLFHSHPFGVDPHFSQTDRETFLTFPYDRKGNVFVLIDPLAGFFKTFIIQDDKLCQVPWVVYTPSLQ